MIQLVCKTDADCKVNGTSAIEGATCVECVCMSEMAGTCGEDSGNFIFIYLNQVFFIKFNSSTLCVNVMNTCTIVIF